MELAFIVDTDFIDQIRSERSMLAFQLAMIDMKLHMLVLAYYYS
ncbi:hypothetical protein [Clostridium sp. 1xD42-85]|nr:hypothetical protein [Clostridium sp. 1xD42-85]